MKKKCIKILLWILITACWTIITLLLSKWFSITRHYHIEDALFFVPLLIAIVGVLIIIGRSSSRSSVEFTSRSHFLLQGNHTANNSIKVSDYHYTWKSFFNGYSILIAGIFCILIGILI